jgi:hypothetical protein
MVAVIFEATMSRDQVEQLVEVMREARPTRPEGVVTAALLVEGEAVQLVAFWQDRDTLDRYLATVEVPRGAELMRRVGVDPTWRIVDAYELG